MNSTISYPKLKPLWQVAHFVYLSYTPTCQTDTANMMVQVQTVKTVQSVFLPACFSGEPQQVGCTRLTCNSEGESTDEWLSWKCLSKLCSTLLHMLVCSVQSTPPCIAPLLCFKSFCNQRSDGGGVEPRELGLVRGWCFTSMHLRE